MGWLEKIGLVERDEPAVTPTPVADVPVETPLVEVNAEIASASNIVDEIYAQNGLSNKSTSIFTVKALIDTLPAEMPTATKQTTVAGILAVSGKAIGDLLADAKAREETLCAAQSKILTERTAEINEAKADIEEMKRAIESANIKIKEVEDIIAALNQSVGDELKAIADLVSFCSGMEAAK